MNELAAKLRATAASLHTKLALKKQFEDAATAIDELFKEKVVLETALDERDSEIKLLNKKIKKKRKVLK